MGSDEFKHRFLGFYRLIYRISFAVVCDKHDAEDTVQEVYEKLWRQRNNFVKVENDEAFVVTIAKNTALDRIRSNARHRATAFMAGNDVDDGGCDEQRMENRETLEFVEKIMLDLPSMQQTVIRLRHFGDLSIPEIAQTMRQTEVNVRQLLSRARKTMKEKIVETYEDRRYKHLTR